MLSRTLAYVKWKDACFRNGQWQAAEEIDTATEFFCESAGFLVKEDKVGVVLAVDYDPDMDTWRGLQFIPRGMVAELRKFKTKGK